ncbi:hypothetical protein ES703_02412 [subsurface metagenome]
MMNSKKQKRIEYSEFIRQIELIDIAMEVGQFAQLHSFQPKTKSKIDVKGNVINWKTFNDKDTIFRYKSTIKIKQKNRIIFESRCIYALFFISEVKFSKKYYKEFVEKTNHLESFVWPYIRQWFAEITERAILPRFTAPLLKSLIKSPIPRIHKKKKN